MFFVLSRTSSRQDYSKKDLYKLMLKIQEANKISQHLNKRTVSGLNADAVWWMFPVAQNNIVSTRYGSRDDEEVAVYAVI